MLGNIPDGYVLFSMGSFLALVGWAVRTHFGQKSVEVRIGNLEARDTAQDLRIDGMNTSLNSIYAELGKMGAKLDAIASSMVRLEGRVDSSHHQ